jgi:hypothetical protein
MLPQLCPSPCDISGLLYREKKASLARSLYQNPHDSTQPRHAEQLPATTYLSFYSVVELVKWAVYTASSLLNIGIKFVNINIKSVVLPSEII